MGHRARAAVLVGLCSAATPVAAESLYAPPAVALELCGDFKAEEVQRALAIEYQDQDHGSTMLTVRCQGESAMLRIVGPNHPEGRVADVSLEGVDVVAMPRTIAVLAAELWTAPEPEPAISVAVVEREEKGLSVNQSVTTKTKHKYTNIRLGVGLQQTSRDVYAGRDSGRYGASGVFRGLVVRADWALVPYFGFFANLSGSANTQQAGHTQLEGPTSWRRGEVGVYGRVFKREKVRVDLRLSFGLDSILTSRVEDYVREETLLPIYEFMTLGGQVSYQANKAVAFRATLHAYAADTKDMTYRYVEGLRAGGELSYRITKAIQAEGRIETSSLRKRADGQGYTDRSSSVELGVSYGF